MHIASLHLAKALNYDYEDIVKDRPDSDNWLFQQVRGTSNAAACSSFLEYFALTTLPLFPTQAVREFARDVAAVSQNLGGKKKKDTLDEGPPLAKFIDGASSFGLDLCLLPSTHWFLFIFGNFSSTLPGNTMRNHFELDTLNHWRITSNTLKTFGATGELPE